MFKGKETPINYGKILAELVIELPGRLEITSLINRTYADRMKLVFGKSLFTEYQSLKRDGGNRLGI